MSCSDAEFEKFLQEVRFSAKFANYVNTMKYWSATFYIKRTKPASNVIQMAYICRASHPPRHPTCPNYHVLEIHQVSSWFMNKHAWHVHNKHAVLNMVIICLSTSMQGVLVGGAVKRKPLVIKSWRRRLRVGWSRLVYSLDCWVCDTMSVRLQCMLQDDVWLSHFRAEWS